jgi:hypothetical protein
MTTNSELFDINEPLDEPFAQLICQFHTLRINELIFIYPCEEKWS